MWTGTSKRLQHLLQNVPSRTQSHSQAAVGKLPWETFFQLLVKKAPRQKRLFKYLSLTRDVALSPEGQIPGRGVELCSKLCHYYSKGKRVFPCCLHCSIGCSCSYGKCFTGWMTDMASLLKSPPSDVALYSLF